MKRTALLLGLLCAWALAAAGWSWTADAPGPTNPHRALYAKSMVRMAEPDRSFDDVREELNHGTAGAPIQLATSKTCSQRCSQRCSVACTTTRGCSTLCKAYTDGCGGGYTAPPTQPRPQTKTLTNEPACPPGTELVYKKDASGQLTPVCK